MSSDYTDGIINWERDTLFVSEDNRNFDYISCLVEAIELGIRLPRVGVTTGENRKYFLNTDGHHRAIAYFLSGKPMPVEIYGEQIYSENPLWKSIGDVRLDTDKIDLRMELNASIAGSFLVPQDFYLTEGAQEYLEACYTEKEQKKIFANINKCRERTRTLREKL